MWPSTDKCKSWTAWCAYLNTSHHLPLERIGQLFQDMTGYRPSDATLLSRFASLSDEIASHIPYIREQLLKSTSLHSDETGMRIKEKTQWLHTVSSTDWTLYQVHEKCGKVAIDAHNMLPQYNGVLIHDCWASYFNKAYSFEHALCGAHLLRECQGILDYDGQKWARAMKGLLQEAAHYKKIWRQTGTPIPEEKKLEWTCRYDEILQNGEREWAAAVIPNVLAKRGRKK